jgi:hypothetical protein
MNGEGGQGGSLRIYSTAADMTVQPHMGGGIIEADPGGGTITITLPSATCSPGLYLEIDQVGTGTVQIRTDGGGAAIESAAAVPASPDLTAQFTTARVRRRSVASWRVDGSI